MTPIGSPSAIGQVTESEHVAYFEDQLRSNEEFWRRFGKRPDFAGKTVLDLGCGHGAMTKEVALAGGSVLGIDLDEVRVAFARRHVTAPGVEFRAVDLAVLGLDSHFDLALSKDTFEHVDDLPSMLRALRKALKPGGELWAGFSPLYHSPFGDHGRAGLKVPWAHTLLPDRLVFRAAERRNGHPVHSLGDIGLNGLTAEEFQAGVAASGFEVVTMDFNRGSKPMMRTLDRLRKVPGLAKLATVGIYTVLRRSD